MRNCLVTQLKEVVNNDNLPIFDTVKVFINPEVASTAAVASRRIVVLASEANKVKLINVGGNFVDNNDQSIGNEYIVTEVGPQYGNTKVFYSNDTRYVLIKGKNYLKNIGLVWDKINIAHLDLEDIRYCLNLEFLSLSGALQEGNLSSLNLLSLRTLVLNTTNVEGNISDLKSHVNLSTFLAVNVDPYNPKIIGDFNSIASTHVQGSIRVTTDTNHITCNGVSPVAQLANQNFNIIFDGQGGVSYSAV